MRILMAMASVGAIPQLAFNVPEPVSMMIWGTVLLAWSSNLRRGARGARGSSARGRLEGGGFGAAFAGTAKG